MSKFFFVLLLCLPFAACEDRSAVEKLQAETEAIHDEAMKDIAELNRTKRAVDNAMDKLDSTAVERRTALLEALTALEKADEDMMAWMAQYEAPSNQPAATISGKPA